MESFTQIAYIIAYDDLCGKLVLLASSGVELSNEIIECMADENHLKELSSLLKNERNNAFWVCAHSTTTMNVINERAKEISLRQLVKCSYELCSLIHEEYKSITDKVLDMITARLVNEHEQDEMDGEDELHITQYEGEMYLRRLY